MNKKPVLIIEKNQQPMNMNESKSDIKKKDYLMEGVFTEFGVVNRNNRIYSAEEFIPQVDKMMEKKQWGVIFGEFDHPDVFDISMKHVSHTVENAFYNKKDNRVDGEIRLLNTHYGRDAKALVDDGAPIFVSSRAAGITESNGAVKIKQLFTYDIVADPGFSAAKMNMKSINESVGYTGETDNFRIFEASRTNLSNLDDQLNKLSDNQHKIFDLSDETKTNELFKMNGNDFITRKQLTDYSKYLSSEIHKIGTGLNNIVKESKGSSEINSKVEEFAEYYENLQSQQSKVIQYLDYIAEKLSVSLESSSKLEKKTDEIVNYSNYLAESLDKNIDYSNYIAENLDKSIVYGEYLAENLDKSIVYGEYLAENLDSNIEKSETLNEKVSKAVQYTEYLAENLDKNISYSEYLAENLTTNIKDTKVVNEKVSKAVKYTEYLAENLDATIGYTEYITENLETNIAYGEYIAENLDKTTNYTEYIAECVDKTMGYADMISEKLNTNSLNESRGVRNIPSASQFITESIEEDDEDDIDDIDNSKDSVSENPATIKSKSKKKNTKTKEVNEFNKFIKSDNKENLSSKIDTLIEEAKKREASKDERPAFYGFLTPEDVKTFESLTNEQQEAVKVALNESVGYYSRKDVINVVRKVVETNEPSKEDRILAGIPEDIQPLWESLDNTMKKSILSQAGFYEFKSDDHIEHFWRTRKINKPLTESKNFITEGNVYKTENMSESDIDAFTNRFKGL